MAKDISEDALATVVQNVETWCATNGCVLIPGSVESKNGVPEVVYGGSPDRGIGQCLSLLEKLAPKVLVLDVSHLSRENWQARVDYITELQAPESKTRLREVQACEDHIGAVAAIAITVFMERPRFMLTYDIIAPWFRAIFAEGEGVLEVPDVGYEDPRTSERIEAMARRVAEDPRFVAAKKQAERQYVAKTILRGEKLDGRDLYHVVQQAAAIYETDVRPKQLASMREKAEQLRQEGYSIMDIAARLDLSGAEVRRLLD